MKKSSCRPGKPDLRPPGTVAYTDACRTGPVLSRAWRTQPVRQTCEDSMPDLPRKQGLYDPAFEHDACGVAFVVDMKGRASHDIVEKGLRALCNLDHRGAA